MKRRSLLLGLAALGAGALWWAKPRDRGAPHDAYFAGLQRLLQQEGPWRPCMLIDLDRLDHNIEVMRAVIQPPQHFRLVAKSLPSISLMQYILARSGSRRLMAFHQPFLNLQAQAFPEGDILLGKPLPAASAARFYARHQGRFNPERQLQWLVDTPERLGEYLALAQGQGLRLRINVEIDVGLHRGGVPTAEALLPVLDAIAAHPRHLQFAGFMGYDAHVVHMPPVLGSRERLVREVQQRYDAFIDIARRRHPALWTDDLTLNAAGSPTYRYWRDHPLVNDLALGSGLLKPSDFDLDTLSQHQPAAFIATPVLKVLDRTEVPGIEPLAKVWAAWDPNVQRAHFLYGGRWMAEPVSPPGLRLNPLYGRSSNQELLNGSAATGLAPNDHVFLRPTQSEAVLLQFGDLLAVRKGRVVDYWPVLEQRS